SLTRRLRIARGEEPADFVLRHARIVNVLSGEIYRGDVVVADGRVVAIGAGYEGRAERDLGGRYLVPGLIDGHMHLESTMMVVAGVLRGDPEVLAKIEAARARGLRVDGHAPAVQGRALNVYAAAGIQSDHESTTVDEAHEKLRLGLWLMVREGSAARNLDA